MCMNSATGVHHVIWSWLTEEYPPQDSMQMFGRSFYITRQPQPSLYSNKHCGHQMMWCCAIWQSHSKCREWIKSTDADSRLLKGKKSPWKVQKELSRQLIKIANTDLHLQTMKSVIILVGKVHVWRIFRVFSAESHVFSLCAFWVC